MTVYESDGEKITRIDGEPVAPIISEQERDRVLNSPRIARARATANARDTIGATYAQAIRFGIDLGLGSTEARRIVDEMQHTAAVNNMQARAADDEAARHREWTMRAAGLQDVKVGEIRPKVDPHLRSFIGQFVTILTTSDGRRISGTLNSLLEHEDGDIGAVYLVDDGQRSIIPVDHIAAITAHNPNQEGTTP